MWILASATISFSYRLRNSSESVQLRTGIKRCHMNMYNLNRRVPAAVQRYESARELEIIKMIIWCCLLAVYAASKKERALTLS